MLLQRDLQLDHLRAWLEEARTGRGRTVLLVAGAGLGKTSLLSAADGVSTDAGFRVLRARGSDLERQMSFGVARQLFEAELTALENDYRERVLTGAAELALPLVAASADHASGDPEAVVHGLYWLCANLAELAPLAVLVDDAQWADHQSLRWLVYLASRVRDVPMLLLVASRPAEPAGTEGRLLTRLAAERAVTELELAPLDPDGVQTLIERGLGCSPDPAFLEACVLSTGGNPFFITELVRVVASAGIEPDAGHARLVPQLTTREVRRSILARLGRLSDAAQRLAEAVAVLGADAELRRAAGLAGLQLEDALSAADLLTGAEILRDERPLAFIHPIAQIAVYEQIPPGARSRAHRRAAQLLADENVRAEQVGAHALACEPAGDPLIVEWLRAAARNATGVGAPDAAAGYLERALREPPERTLRPLVTYELGHVLIGIDVVGAGKQFAEAATVAAPELQVLAHRWRAQTLGFGGDPAAASAAVEQALKVVGTDPEQRLLLESTRDFYALPIASPNVAEPDRQPQQRAEQLPGATPGERRALAVASFDIARTGDAPAARAIDYADRVRAALTTWLDGDQGVETAAGIGQASIIADDPEALARHRRAGAEAARLGRFTNAGAASAQMAQIQFRRGALLEAEADARTSWELLRGQRDGATAFYWWSAAQLLQVLIARGHIADARELVEEIQMDHEPPAALCAFVSTPPGPIVLAELELAEQKTGAAIERLMRDGSWLEGCGWTNPALNPWRAVAAPALARVGRLQEARAVIEPSLTRSRLFAAPWGLGMTLRAAGTVTMGSEGVELLNEAIRILEPAVCRLELAHAQLELGARLRRANQRAEARDILRPALELAHRCGAPPLAEAIRDELAAAGARPRREMLSGLESLTASERRVARLAASGLSNPGIAQQLFVTRKTVETHLGHVYQKLGVSSREALPGALAVEDEPT